MYSELVASSFTQSLELINIVCVRGFDVTLVRGLREVCVMLLCVRRAVLVVGWLLLLLIRRGSSRLVLTGPVLRVLTTPNIAYNTLLIVVGAHPSSSPHWVVASLLLIRRRLVVASSSSIMLLRLLVVSRRRSSRRGWDLAHKLVGGVWHTLVRGNPVRGVHITITTVIILTLVVVARRRLLVIGVLLLTVVLMVARFIHPGVRLKVWTVMGMVVDGAIHVPPVNIFLVVGEVTMWAG